MGEDNKGEGSHPLRYSYTFHWYQKKSGSARAAENYEKNIKAVATFGTVEEFWNVYNHLMRPHTLATGTDLQLFKEGIKPLWEDDQNRNGGKWIMRCKKGNASKYWEDMVLALIGEEFDVDDEICGIVVSTRFSEDIISVWTKTAENREICLRIRDTMKRVLQPASTTMFEYKRHDESLKDNSSFRNTAQF